MTPLLVSLLVLAAALVLSPDPARRLLAVARPRSQPPGSVVGHSDVPLLVDLVAAALGAGATPVAALDIAGRAVGGHEGEEVVRVAARLRLGSDWAGAWTGTSAPLEPLQRCLGLALSVGAPGAGLLRATASELRRRRHRSAQLEASRLGVRLVLPLGLCALPAFLVLGVVPVVLSLATELLTDLP